MPTDKLLFQEHGLEIDSQLVENSLTQNPNTSNLRSVPHKTIVDKLKSHLTEEELANEKKIESQQLEEIFKLMQTQDKFQLGSKEDIQNQLELYGLLTDSHPFPQNV